MQAKRGNEKTYREDVHGRLHDDVEQLALARLRVDGGVIAALHAENDLEHVRDADVAPAVLVRRVQVPLGQVQVLPERPRARAHEVRHNLPDVIIRADELGQGRVLESVLVVGHEWQKRRPVLLGVLEGEERNAVDGVCARDASETRPIVDALCNENAPVSQRGTPGKTRD